MIDLKNLAQEVQELEINRDSTFFHDLVARLAGLLDFRPAKEWYEADPFIGPPAQYVTRAELEEASITYKFRFKNYSHRKRYEKNIDFLVATTHHPDLLMLDLGIYVARSLMSNTTLGLKKKIIPIDEVRLKFPSIPGRDSLALAFEADHIIQTENNLYFMHPKYLYELVKNKRG
ncbi:hypothetical protein AYK26_06165 [Euryarchaeota archaeon SM23-78]|nr:MAG: hypothetical protein AYK26_06165 [Euryarchaeota archaeon SM23-78]MBW3001211.1 hypothetical protein [Candidatus Woesearchaeota archaeon]